MNVYRFGDKVAVNPPSGPTFYMDAEAAQMFAFRVGQAALDIQITSFQESTLRTREIEGFSE